MNEEFNKQMKGLDMRGNVDHVGHFQPLVHSKDNILLKGLAMPDVKVV